MNIAVKIALMAAAVALSPIAQADPARDCLLEGTVAKDANSGSDVMKIRLHSIEKYDQDANCRMRRDRRMEFKLPDDPRLKEAPAGSEVKFRYQYDGEGNSKTDLISVDSSTSA